MRRNLYWLSFLILSLGISFLMLPDTFAQDEHGSENTEQKGETAASSLTRDEHKEEKESEHGHIKESGEDPHVHNSLTAEAAQWVGVATLPAAAAVTLGKLRSADKLVYKYAVLILSTGVGIMHVLLTPDHLADVNIEHAIFFALLGSAQIAFGLLFMFRPTRNLAVIGTGGNIGSIILYWVTRAENLPEPLGAPEGIDSIGIIAKMVEVFLVCLLIYLAVWLRKSETLSVRG